MAIFAEYFTNDGTISAGDSDESMGGSTHIKANNTLTNNALGLIKTGKNDDGLYNALFVKAPSLTNSGIFHASSTNIDPTLISLTGTQTKVEGEDITIYGGEDAVLKFEDLVEDAILSTGNITLAVGNGGTIDFRGITGKVFKAAGEVKIHTDNILLDEGVSLTDLIDASNIITAPAKIIYNVVVLAPDQFAGQVGETISVNFTIANNGPETDTYNIAVTDANGWTLGDLPTTVTLEGTDTRDLALDVTLPSTSANNVITLTVTSQTDSEVSQTVEIQVAAATEILDESEMTEEDKEKFKMGDYKASGQLLDKSGNPIGSAIVKIGDKTAVTDENGNWEIIGLNKGDYTIEASKEGYTFEPTNFTVNDGDVELNVIGQPDIVDGIYGIYGTIKDDLNSPIAGVTVQTGDKTVITDAAGNWEIPDLQEGDNYVATAEKEGYTFAPENFALGNNVPRTEIVIKPISDLKMKVTASNRTVRQDDNLTYTITVINGGEKPATGIVLTDELPEGTSLVSIKALDGGECNADTLTCSLPDLTTGNFAKVELVIHNNQTKNLVNTATVTSNEYPTNVVKTRTRVIPHLSVSISDTPDPIAMAAVNGERILHYTITAELSPKAPTAATGIELLTTLPKGVEVQSINSDAAMCEINNPQTVTCQLKDLSVTNPEDISSVNVALDVKLNDAGLLVLTNETKVSALEYPAHTYRERTQVFVPPEYKVKLAFVIDVTGSMQAEMNGVKGAILEVIEELKGQSAFPLSALVVFRDDVSVKAVTSDGTILTNAVERLKASQGGTCPEASAEALNKAIDHVEDGGSILFVTDASPYEDADIDALIERLLSHNIRVNVLMTGDCTNPDSWNKLPNAE